MSKTLILLFHPNMASSRANKALSQAAQTLEGVEVVDLYSLYPNFQVDSEKEIARLLGADRIVWQFPVHWYSQPPMMQVYLDTVFTRLYYGDKFADSQKLSGKPHLITATIGSGEEAYTCEGVNCYTMDAILTPLKALAARCQYPLGKSFFVYEAMTSSDERLAEKAQDYKAHLAQWISEHQ